MWTFQRDWLGHCFPTVKVEIHCNFVASVFTICQSSPMCLMVCRWCIPSFLSVLPRCTSLELFVDENNSVIGYSGIICWWELFNTSLVLLGHAQGKKKKWSRPFLPVGQVVKKHFQPKTHSLGPWLQGHDICMHAFPALGLINVLWDI